MTRNYRRLFATTFCVAVILSLNPQTAELGAQELRKKLPKSSPVVVACAASFERLMDDVDYLFEVAGRPELTETIGGALANVNDLKGFNRRESAGLLIFVDGIIPEPVAFVPVNDLETMLKSISVGPVTTNKKADGLYEILGVQQVLFARFAGEYAFIARNQAALNRDFDNPAQYTRRLASQYDFALSVNPRAIPKPTRDLLLTIFRAKTEIELQQRDKENSSQFRLRKAAVLANLETLEMFAREAEEITIGYNMSAEDKSVFAEIVATADPKTELARYLNELGSARSQFTTLLQTPSSLTAAVSLQFEKVSRNYLKEWMLINQEKLIKGFAKLNDPGDAEPIAIAELFHSLRATLSDGRLDLIVQLLGDPPGPFTLIAGLRIAETDHFNVGMGEIYGRLKKRGDFQVFEPQCGEHRGVTLSRLQLSHVPESADRLFGKDHSFFTGAGHGSFWVAIGSEKGLPTLKNVIQQVIDTPVSEEPVMPFQLSMHVANWLQALENPDGDSDPIVELMRESFAKGGGTIRAELKPVANGLQGRITLDEGFIRLAGKIVAKRIDENGK